jgi:hypothetical protein
MLRSLALPRLNPRVPTEGVFQPPGGYRGLEGTPRWKDVGRVLAERREAVGSEDPTAHGQFPKMHLHPLVFASRPGFSASRRRCGPEPACAAPQAFRDLPKFSRLAMSDHRVWLASLLGRYIRHQSRPLSFRKYFSRHCYRSVSFSLCPSVLEK